MPDVHEGAAEDAAEVAYVDEDATEDAAEDGMLARTLWTARTRMGYVDEGTQGARARTQVGMRDVDSGLLLSNAAGLGQPARRRQGPLADC